MSTQANLFHNNSFKRKGFGKAKFWPHIYMALFAAGWVFTYEGPFRFYIAELLSVIGIVLIPWRTSLKQYPMARQIIWAYVLWVIAIFVSDWVNATDNIDMLRNIANPVIGALSLIAALAAMSRNPNALISFLVVSAVLKAIFGDPAYGDAFSDNKMSLEALQEDMNYFKVRFEPFLTPFILVVSCWLGRKSKKKVIGVFLLTAVLYFYVDSRSGGIVFLLTALFLSFNSNIKYKDLFTRWILGALLAYSAYAGYIAYTLSFNPEGHNGKQLVNLENPYNPFSLLLIGRGDWIAIPKAFYERPLFGWGSWAQDTSGKFGYLIQNQQGFYQESQSTYIPVHSIIGSACIWSGFLGLIAMLWLFSSIFKMGSRLRYVKSDLLPAVQFFTVLIVWHFFFSPPQHVRLTFPLALASLIILTRDEKANNYKQALSEGALNKPF
jgi:hypothetical protein